MSWFTGAKHAIDLTRMAANAGRAGQLVINAAQVARQAHDAAQKKERKRIDKPRRVYAKRHKKGNDIYEIEIPEEDEEEGSIAAFIRSQEYTSMFDVHASTAMAKLNDPGRGLHHILLRHGDDFQELGLNVDGDDPHADQIELLDYLRKVFRRARYLGQEYGQSGQLRFAWRVQDTHGRDRILLVAYSSQTYEVSGVPQITRPFREIITAFLLPRNETAVFKRPDNFVDDNGRNRPETGGFHGTSGSW
ncbi:unnamed protein product [Didymodactylos carnosus]|uniref:Uncharacterized protein n=1 Tax=Didymodactylos carnosus TaxID=1234261 RepID=A0A814DLD6_9BILA|nr:unnamed protein product [Didymodactylos carnosus]CAF1063729.1 unnamed protein product [Didymodactylos carnosus]CAF3730970.1 unnamed protein product [Didymodactylos carnosus]CAF3829027.1 unnamed protein product [Didymodactylos carnosus]